ncbi:MAG TPA: hypothetical protein DIS74_06235 [Bacteroidales bacterium]|nr:hypothetical protein [Bacteroidales bacterium]
MKKHELVILANEIKSDHEPWIRACEKRAAEVSYRVADLTSAGWFEEVTAQPAEFLLVKPGGLSSRFKKLYDERLTILAGRMNYPCFPSLDEVLIHENKIFQSYWLKAEGLPHPTTYVFYHENEAAGFARTAKLPVVAKLNIGSSGKGVTILKTREELTRYIRDIFSGGKRSRGGPNLERGQWLQRAARVFSDRDLLRERLYKYRSIQEDIQTGFILFQEYVPHDYEWRAVRIGDSFFAHKKLKIKDKASGSLIKEYLAPPEGLLDFLKEVTDRFGFRSMSVDLFEDGKGSYLINEMQCIFGQSDPYQTAIEGKAGRFVNRSGMWVFEAGDFASNQCFDLRLDHVIGILTAE